MPLPKDLKIAIIGLGYATLLDAETEHEYNITSLKDKHPRHQHASN